MIRFLLPALVLFSAAFVAQAEPRAAAAETQVLLSTVTNEYPQRLIFRLGASSTANITDVTLSYSITARGTSALGKPEATITPSKQVTTQVTIQVNSAASYIPVGSEFTYHWEVRTDDGQTYSSPDTKFLYLPTNQDWKSLQNEILSVYYHGNKEALAQSYLEAGDETWKKIGVDLLRTQLKFTPVKVILFDNEAEMNPARPGSAGSTFDAAVTTCGTKVTADIVLVIPVSCGTPDRTDTLRHEFGHIINQAAGEGPLGKLPSWLDEGTAVYAQTRPGDNYSGAFNTAVNRDRLIPFGQMGTPSGDASAVNLFYGQSYFMTKYLVDKGGPEKFSLFFATIKKGSRFDEALKTVYGFDLAGFEQEFRGANNLSAQASPTAGASPTRAPQQSSQPTVAPTSRSQAQLDDGDDGGGIATSTLLIVGLAVVFGLLAILSFLATQMLGNSRRAQPAGAPHSPAPTAPTASAPPPTPTDEWAQRPPPPASGPPTDPPPDRD